MDDKFWAYLDQLKQWVGQAKPQWDRLPGTSQTTRETPGGLPSRPNRLLNNPDLIMGDDLPQGGLWEMPYQVIPGQGMQQGWSMDQMPQANPKMAPKKYGM